MKKSFRKQKEKLLDLSEKLSDTLDIPYSSIPGISYIEITGNREVIVDGCKGILQYDEDVIKLNAGHLVIRFTGNDLTICSMQAEQALIKGQILSIDFTS